ncbi:sporulation protein [Flavobacterium magnum]|uniref:Sporulation protein n=1 Tax=Flavobacterium magnum TaxID=2162713 RepID=A0A2S0RFN2_9FLAO|nr:SPOR domain-containing protein [Flavobacterium magnum]AWA29522.1 sporulation protein [Flavobacterium magnum]
MKKWNGKTALWTIGILILSAVPMFSQESKTIITQDPKFENLLKEKRRINSSITVNDRYKIQIYTGDSETSKKALADFRKKFKNYDGTIIFNTPFYKVWVGNLKTRIEAERSLSEIKGEYPNALLIRPNK